MKNSKLNMFGDMGIVPENGGKVKSFDRAKRDFETAFCNGADYSAELLDLATAIAFSVINKCIDPTRKFAPTREQTSHSGLNPAMLDVKRDIAHDMALLENTRRNVERATATAYNDEGDTYTAIVDKDAFTAVSDLIGECLGEGIDLVQEAALALIEQAAEHANGEKWLDTPYTVRRLSKRVYIKTTDSAAYRDEETTPIREAYRAVRRHIMSSRAVQTDPRNGYVYIDAMTPDGLETMFYRMGKWEDIGSYDSMGNYTAGIETAQTYESIVEKLNLTDRQATILHLRMQGYGYTAIGTYLGITDQAVRRQMVRLRDRAAAIGFCPDGYEVTPKPPKAPTPPKQPKEPKPPKAPSRPAPTIAVIQIDGDGNEIARYDTYTAASNTTGIDRRNIYHAIKGIKQKTAGGFYWRVEDIQE